MNREKRNETRLIECHCADCKRGGNGDRSCAAGWTVKNKRGANRWRMCFAGEKIDLRKKGGAE